MSHKLNEVNLKVFLKNHCGFDGDLQVKKFPSGQSNPTYYLKIGAKELVLRKKPGGKLLPGAHQVGREYRVMKALHSVGFPVPRVIVHCTDTDVIGTEFFIMEFLEGRVHSRESAVGTAKDIKESVLSAVETIAKLHSIDPEKIGLGDYGKTKGYCSRQVNTWWRQYQAAKHKTIPEMDELADWLKSNIPPDVERASIVHGDYSMMNIMFHPTKNEVKAVLDWELSTLGHPLADLAYLCMVYSVPQYMVQGLYGELDLPSVMREEGLISHYCRIRGIQFPPSNWNFFKALGLFRLASIVQGVYARFLHGNASQASSELMEQMIQPLAEAGLKAARNSDSLSKMSLPVTLSPSAKGQDVLKRVKAFIEEHIKPNETAYFNYLKNAKDKWCVVPLVEELKAKAKAQGLWNLFLPDVSGLSNVDYSHIAEQLGKYVFASEVFNCSAPDTGNMEVLHLYGDAYQKAKWLKPLLEGEIRSAFCMTEPAVASSDATNMELSISPDGDSYIVHGRKWWSSGAGDPRCKFGIVMGRTERSDSRGRHGLHSMIVVPFDTPGVKIIRPLTVFGHEDYPHGHMEIDFNNVRVPKRNLILGEGRGFEIAQGRLGPGRIHHCMRSIGVSERCLEMFVSRAAQRRTFGKRLIEHQVNQHHLARCRIEIDQARLLVLYTAHMIDMHGPKAARKQIAMIKVAAIETFKNVVDKTIQIYGGAGVSQDFPLAAWYAGARSLQIADGPDEVHLGLIAKMEIGDQMKKAKL
ncbi:acyl-CoA dehydrogenase family member 11-like [Styela clava]